MKHRFHDEIVYTKVCGIPMLVALNGSWDRFRAVRELSPLQACFCEGISQGMDEDGIINAIVLPEKLSRETVRDRYRAFSSKMVEEGSLIEEDGDDRS